MTLLQIKNITCGYDDIKDIIKDISYEVNKGDFLGLIGPNGSGKTTLLRAIIGFLKLKKGSIIFKDKHILEPKEIAFVPNILDVPFGFTVKDFILMGRHPHMGRLTKLNISDLDSLEKVLELLHISHLRNRDIRHLSSGEFSRVLISQGLIQEPELLILDEPIAHLDIKHKAEIMKILKQLNKIGLTIISVFHDLNIASDYCKNILMLKDGYLYKEGSTLEVLNKNNIEKVYELEVLIKESPLTGNNYIYF